MKNYFGLAFVAMGLSAGFHPATAQSLTFTSSTISLSHPADWLAVADINGDSYPDLVCSAGGATVWTNNRSGGFGLFTTLTVGAACLAVADINGDGEPDLVCADYGSGPGYPGTLTVLTNNGHGRLTVNATAAVGSMPTCVVAADLNGDGRLDLVCADWYWALYVLINNGLGGFNSPSILNTGGYTSSVIATDVDGDGRVDLISAKNLSTTLTVMTNSGSSFGFHAAPAVGTRPHGLAVADVNGDGKVDLISANEDGTLTVLTNDGSGNLAASAAPTVGGTPVSVAAADINGDGKVDLICANWTGNALTVFTNDGSGNFGLNTMLSANDEPFYVVAADVNGDGKADLISANVSNTLTVFTQNIVPPPTLGITSTAANTLVISWSSDLAGFALQTNSDLATTNWIPAGFPVATADGTNQSVTIPLSANGNLFFRLKR
ncbi:MAG TPA: VCBS repeat-containing protein [Candidatus Acidoferrum sp.]|nr:VCBS repeat-containing protein [Candidatus Acidoferrum sp.]